MAQLVQFQLFTKEDLQSDAGVAKFNQFMSDVVSQIQAMQGTTGKIKPDADIDLQGKYKIINPQLHDGNDRQLAQHLQLGIPDAERNHGALPGRWQ